MHYIDIHCHLNLKEFSEDWQTVLKKCQDQSIGLINVGADLETSKLALKIAEGKDGVWATVGCHPTDAGEMSDKDWTEMERLAENDKVVAIGECGLEYARLGPTDLEERDHQIALFHKHIQLALKVGKPLMIHCRDSQRPQAEAIRDDKKGYPYSAYEDVLNIVRSYQETGKPVVGNMHFFAGDLVTAKAFLASGFTLSFTGVITFTHDYDEVIKAVPLESILAETDAPFVAPVPYRGQRCEPWMVEEVVKKIAEIKGLPVEEVERQMIFNAKRVFGI